MLGWNKNLTGTTLAICLLAGTARAQSEAPPAGVSAPSDQADYVAKGLPLGGFRLFPALTSTPAYDDNVYRTDTALQDSFYDVLSPTLDLKSQWSRHSLELMAGLDQYWYRSLRHEDHLDYHVAGNGRLDILRGLTANTDVSYTSRHEQRTSEDLPTSALTPTRYTVFHGSADIEHAIGRFGLRAGGRYDRYRFDATALAGGGRLDNTDRNRSEYSAYANADYEFSPGYAVFLRGTYDDRSYQLKVDRNGLDRDSRGYRIDAGLDMLVTRLIQGNFFLGYSRQDYKAPLKAVSGFDYGAKLTWYPTPLITVHLNGERTIHETTIVNASANDERKVDTEIDYAFRRNVILLASGGYASDVYAGAGRTDDTVLAGVGAKYLANEYMQWNLRYDYSSRSSPLPVFRYTDNMVQLGLTLQL